MRVVFAAAILALLPYGAFAQTGSAAPTASPPTAVETGSVSPLAVATGVVVVAIIADVVTRGALSGPLLRAAGWQEPAAAQAVAATGAATPAVTVPAAVAPAAVAATAATAPAAAAAPAVSLTRPWWRFW